MVHLRVDFLQHFGVCQCHFTRCTCVCGVLFSPCIRGGYNPGKEKPQAKKAPKVERVDQKAAAVETAGGRLYGAKNTDSRLKIAANSRVWVRIEDKNGNVVLNQTLLSGDAFNVPNRKGLVLIARDHPLFGAEHGS